MLSQQKRGAGRQEVDLDETSFAGPNEAPVPKNRIENGQKRSHLGSTLFCIFAAFDQQNATFSIFHTFDDDVGLHWE